MGISARELKDEYTKEIGMGIWSLEPVSQEIFASITKFIKGGKGEIQPFPTERLQQWRHSLLDNKEAELNSFRQRWADMDFQIDKYYSDRKLLDSDKHQDAKIHLYDEYNRIRLEKIAEYGRIIEEIDMKIIWSLEPVCQEVFTSIAKFIKEGKGGIKLFSIEELRRWRSRLLDSKEAELDSFCRRWADMDSQIDKHYSDMKSLDSDIHQDAKVQLYDEYNRIRLEEIIEYNRINEKIDIRMKKLESSRE